MGLGWLIYGTRFGPLQRQVEKIVIATNGKHLTLVDPSNPTPWCAGGAGRAGGPATAAGRWLLAACVTLNLGVPRRVINEAG